MPDSKLSDLTALTTLTGDDLLYVVDNPSGTPVDRKITAANLLKAAYAGVATIPVVVLGTGGLTQSLAAINNSWWVLEPTAWPTAPTGLTLQYRLHAMALGLTAGDVFGVQYYNNTDSSGFGAEFTATGAADTTAHAVSAWTAFPVSHKSGYVMARNQTAVRGQSVSAFIELAFR